MSLLLLLQMPEARVTGVSVVDGDCQIEAALEASRKIIDLFGGKQAPLEVAASDSRPHHQFVTGVSVVDGDCQIEAALEASRKIIDLFGGKQAPLEVAASDSRPHHQFPSEWRGSAFTFDALPMLNEHGAPRTPIAARPAHLDLVDKVMAEEGKTTLLFTGPLTDLARALDAEPAIEEKIETLFWMGGSLDGHGNVVDPCFDGTAEWNAFWDPEAVKRVWDSSLEIHMVGLESTEELPLTRELCQHWAELRRYPAIDLIGQGYALVSTWWIRSWPRRARRPCCSPAP